MRIKSLARTRSSIETLLLAAGVAVLALSSLGSASNVRADAKADARDQFEQAVSMRTSLEGYLPKDRSLDDYKQTVAAYHKVYLISPRAEEVSPALIAEGELYQAMARQFDPRYSQAALEAYKFLLQKYSDSRYASTALFSIAQIEKDDLNEPDSAETDFKEFLRRFPKSDKTADAKRSLKELAANRGNGMNSDAVARINASSSTASLTVAALPTLQGQTVDPQQSTGRAPFVKKIQTWNLADSARVIVTLDGTVALKSAIIQSPERIYFDLQKATLGPDLAHNSIALNDGLLKSVHIAQNRPDTVRVVLDADGAKNYSTILLSSPYRLVIEVHAQAQPFQIALSGPATKITPMTPVKSRASLDIKNAALQPPSSPKPTRDGQSSLTRELGLKISRIVIDAGHGGYDTGTIGPHGLLEKDLCLDVALRLGALIEQKLPGAEVIYTRKDDTFVPLEDRTAIANDAKADLFISIHANSSHDPDARGIETYYLNFSSSPDSMEVATRENSVSQQSVHDLQDLIKKIARNDKIEESKELAGDIQDSLTQRLQLVSRDERNRGVKKAPFVVLIGANMPSILSEISFVSNPNDERLLKKTDQRQRIADGLLRGITSYLGNLNSLASNKQKLVSDNHLDGSPLASAGNSK
jgi:N-acetylmuramoyl-L-alanine amidase